MRLEREPCGGQVTVHLGELGVGQARAVPAAGLQSRLQAPAGLARGPFRPAHVGALAPLAVLAAARPHR
jgi:hypothetical protein